MADTETLISFQEPHRLIQHVQMSPRVGARPDAQQVHVNLHDALSSQRTFQQRSTAGSSHVRIEADGRYDFETVCCRRPSPITAAKAVTPRHVTCSPEVADGFTAWKIKVPQTPKKQRRRKETIGITDRSKFEN
jgi:hypothetical protein